MTPPPPPSAPAAANHAQADAHVNDDNHQDTIYETTLFPQNHTVREMREIGGGRRCLGRSGSEGEGGIGGKVDEGASVSAFK